METVTTETTQQTRYTATYTPSTGNPITLQFPTQEAATAHCNSWVGWKT